MRREIRLVIHGESAEAVDALIAKIDATLDEMWEAMKPHETGVVMTQYVDADGSAACPLGAPARADCTTEPGSHSGQANRAFEMVRKKFRRSPQGHVEGWGFKVFP